MKNPLFRACTFVVAFSLVATMTACSQSQSSAQLEQTSAIGQMRDVLRAKSLTAAASFAAGLGTKDDPYQIGTPEELTLLATKVNSDSQEDVSYASAHYILVSDIILNDTSDFESWSEKAPVFGWDPIGNGSDQGHEFTGTFDGSGHVISGLYLCTDVSGYNTYPALFGKASDAIIKNVVLEKAFVRTLNQVGSCAGIVGDAYRSRVDACEVEIVIANEAGSIGGTGGVVGRAASTDIVNCNSEGTVAATAGALGGIAGSFSQGALDFCTNGCAISATESATAGGVAGEVFDGGKTDYAEGTFEAVPTTVQNCVNNGSIEYHGSDSTVFLGGVCGSVLVGSSSIVVDGCANYGMVSFDEGVAGGIAGKAWASEPLNAKLASDTPTLTISDSKNVGEVRALSPDGVNLGSGGIVGSIQSGGSSLVSIVTCENSGSVSSYDSVAGGICASCLVQASASLRIDSCTNVGLLGNRGGLNGGIVGLMQTHTLTEEALGNSDSFEEGDSPDPLTPEELASVDIAEGSIVVTACNNAASFAIDKGTFGLGGIVGQLVSPNRAVSIPIEIVQCANSGAFAISSFSYCGGIVGNVASAASPVTLRLCANEGDVKALLSSDDEDEDMTSEQAVQAQWRLGGIVGVAPSVLTTIDRCTNIGSMEVIGANKTSLEGGENFGRVRTGDIAATLY